MLGVALMIIAIPQLYTHVGRWPPYWLAMALGVCAACLLYFAVIGLKFEGAILYAIGGFWVLFGFTQFIAGGSLGSGVIQLLTGAILIALGARVRSKLSCTEAGDRASQ